MDHDAPGPDEPDRLDLDDPPAARWGWTLRLVLLLAAMVIIPGIAYRLTTPDPVTLAVAPLSGDGSSGADPDATMAEAVAGALDARPGLAVVPWNLGRPEGADLVLEVGPAAGGLRLLLYRWPERAKLWEGRVAGAATDSVVARAARAVEAAIFPPD